MSNWKHTIKQQLLWLGVILLIFALAAGVAYLIDGPPGVEEEQPINSTVVEVDGLDGEVKRFTDPETNSTCYVYEPTKGDPSISCITDK